MLTEKVKDSLKGNWGDKADALDCYAEVKFIDPRAPWSCYIFAMEPTNEDNIRCLIQNALITSICDWSMQELLTGYNEEGEHPIIDQEFRPIRVNELYRRLINDT